ncbi:hypothetical protein [Phenylobacterium sp.]|uniref:hypothetical protein n=1 Tax=Phenylobacterium sp. TaxID=1871053 RepID=UPI0025CC7748|nr:hypothetical protein [Phenylobacterium sp.]MCA6286677.1 hypothetical protein [Phenylobacterium sp.]MCA6309694.1 hypothetical protein [Phenylobacterium sp.]MCA6323577.1 hypothetical protein [Phenylobacterium sp.]MCA6336196.1 hypothetical protein [Phenylobacterium sp.]MCA6338941.1 hypothetical protein [Phenylobacterium sp.]
MTDTTAIFRHAHPDEIAAPRPPPGLARALADEYPDASIADYVLSGRYFRAAGRRFRNWRRDTFRPAETTAGVWAG